jgi:hypothetical protein
MALKTSLTTEEIFKVAYLHHVLGVEQHALSIAYSVNAGRIAEACIAMAYAADNVRSIYHKAKTKDPTIAALLEPAE